MMTENQKVSISFPNEIELYIKREDRIHPLVSGNKFRKLKYNLIQAQKEKRHSILTFGGAYSNHIVATAAAAKEKGFRSIGVIRGEELASQVVVNPTLSLAQSLGMQFEFVTREQYREKSDVNFIETLRTKWGDFYLVPEGGTNELAVQGCEEILQPEDEIFDFIACAVGTGGTISGLSRSAFKGQKVLGFSSLKTNYLQDEIHKFAGNANWEFIQEYHFGGYGKTTDELVLFINDFYKRTGIPLDPVYTGKMMYGLVDQIEKGLYKNNTKILAIHTGGLQGIKGMNKVLELKKRKIIEIDDL